MDALQRDHDIAAIVCRGGLIDLAGILYLRSLASPLLLLHEQSDVQHIASNRRALQEVRCPCGLRIIADIGFDFAVSPGFDCPKYIAVVSRQTEQHVISPTVVAGSCHTFLRAKDTHQQRQKVRASSGRTERGFTQAV